MYHRFHQAGLMEMRPFGVLWNFLLGLCLSIFIAAPSGAQPLDIFNSLEPFPVDVLAGGAGVIDLESLDEEERPAVLEKYRAALKTARGREEKNLLAFGAAVLYRQMAEPQRALQTLTRDISGNFILQDHLLDEMARLHLALAQGDFAMRDFRSAAQRTQQAIDFRFEVFRAYPDSPFSASIARDIAEAERFLGDIHFQEGNHKAAWQAYRRALMRDFEGNEEHRLQVNLALADTYTAARQYKDAADIYGFLKNEFDGPEVRERAERFFSEHGAELKTPDSGSDEGQTAPPAVKFSRPRVKKPHAVKVSPLTPSHPSLREFYEALAESDLSRALDKGYQVLKRIPGNEETRGIMEPLKRQIIIYLRTHPWDSRVGRIIDLYPVGELNGMGHRLWGSGLSTHAANLFEKILERHPLEIEECHKSLFFLGRIWEDKGNTSRALGYYNRLVKEYDFGPYTTDARFKIPWIERLDGRHAEAKAHFQELIDYYDTSSFKKLQQAYPNLDSYRSATRFWLAETEAALGDAQARARHLRILVDEFPFSFYGVYSQEILGLDLRAFLSREDGQDVAQRKFGLGEVERKHLRRSESLIAAGLPGRARFELDQLREVRGHPAFMFYLTRLMERAGAFQKSIRLSWSIALRHNLERLSRDLAESLFPKAYLDKVRRAALKYNLDPLFVISLIRQESAFDPQVVSTANAVGLMQLMPGTAAHVARARENRPPTAEELRNPATNIELGTEYLNGLLADFQGNLVHALASYNAGPRKVRSWLRIRSRLSPLEFMESIPYNETRGYVKQILRNYAVYQSLYHHGSARPIKDLLTKAGD